MAICRPEAIDDAPARGPEQSGGWRRGDFLASRGMGEAQGKKVEPTPLRLRRSRRSRPLARSANERPSVARRTATSGEVVANLKGPAQEHRHHGRRDGGHSVEKGRHRLSPTDRTTTRPATGCSSAGPRSGPPGRSAPVRAAITSRSSWTIRASPTRSLPARFDNWGTQRASMTLVAQPPVSRRAGAPGALSVRRQDKQRHTREGSAARENGDNHGERRLPSAAGHADAG